VHDRKRNAIVLITALFGLVAPAVSQAPQTSTAQATVQPAASVSAQPTPAAAAQVAALPVSAPMYVNPVIAGDHPDPSIIRTGDEYWATATGSEWAPVYPLLRSRDLVNWTEVGAIFPDAPSWAEGSFWAPELSEYKGRYFVFYTARAKNGPLCVASAVADAPTGPYQDNGPLICQEVGSIDAFPTVDENGERYLIWKEDGNSRNLPTPLWAQRLSEDGTSVIGEPKEILRNDPATWEKGVVEAPYILRRGGFFYLFYSGSACCGLQCSYGLGVARSEKLLGPYVKFEKNPLVRGSETWKCPGHGSIVTDQQGRTFLLYHAYSSKDFVFTGRQAVLDEVTWTSDGWPAMNGGRGVSVRAASPLNAAQKVDHTFFDHFETPDLRPGWQWPQGRRPVFTLSTENNGVLSLAPSGAEADELLGAVLARPTISGDYVASTQVLTGSIPQGAQVGLAAYGDIRNAIGIAVSSEGLAVWERRDGKNTTLTKMAIGSVPELHLRMTAKKGHELQFAYSPDGKTWTNVGAKLDGAFLTPWDRSIRVAIFTGGAGQNTAQFHYMRIVPEA